MAAVQTARKDSAARPRASPSRRSATKRGPGKTMVLLVPLNIHCMVCVHICMHICICVCMYLYIFTHTMQAIVHGTPCLGPCNQNTGSLCVVGAPKEHAAAAAAVPAPTPAPAVTELCRARAYVTDLYPSSVGDLSPGLLQSG